MILRRITAEEALPIRSAILRPGQPVDRARYAEDPLATTFHLGAFTPEGKLVGISTIYAEARPGTEGRDHWRLRGMATLPEVRGQGYGAALVRGCIEHIAENGGHLFWCNAREVAGGFYENLGFRKTSDLFEISGIGPHWVMEREIKKK